MKDCGVAGSRKDEPTLDDIDVWWREMFSWIKGVEPQVKLTELAKSKWPKLYRLMVARRRAGVYVQALVTGLLDAGGIEIVEAEREKRAGSALDVDILVRVGGHPVPIQVALFYGEAVYGFDEVVHRFSGEPGKNGGYVDTKAVNVANTSMVRKKIRQTPSGGITLFFSDRRMTHNLLSPSDDWWYEGMGEKCVVLYENRTGWIYHAGGPVDAAKRLCRELGCGRVHTRSVKPRLSHNHPTHLQFSPKTAAGLEAAVHENPKEWTNNPDTVIGALYYPEFARSYFAGLQGAGAAVQTENLTPTLRHVVGTYWDSMLAGADDEKPWRDSLVDILQTFEELAKDKAVLFNEDSLVDICSTLCDVADGRYDDHMSFTLGVGEIRYRLHLQALFCLAHMVIYRLRNRTPPAVLEKLAEAACRDGQEGWEHRIVLGYALILGLPSAIPDWYSDNESLLFGKDSPDGMNAVLMRVCSHAGITPRYDMHNPVFDVMERYHAVARTALADEIQSMPSSGPERNEFARLFMRHVLRGTDGYDVVEAARYLVGLGNRAVSVSCGECGLLLDKDVDAAQVERGVMFWECVLDQAPRPDALKGFGCWALAEAVGQDIWERLMLRTCEAAGGLVDMPEYVMQRAAADGSPTGTGMQIIKLVRLANESVSGDLSWQRTMDLLDPDAADPRHVSD